MAEQQPHIIVIAGANGSGKSTTAPSLLKGTLGVTEFVNADVIAEGLSAFYPEGVAFHAGRVMLERIHLLAKERVDFAFETTLASRTFAPWIKELKQTGYFFQLYMPLADTWLFYGNSVAGVPKLLASGGREIGTSIENGLIWKQIQEEYNDW